jgi:hypothetical protein
MSNLSEGLIVILTTIWPVAKVRERLAVSKQAEQMIDTGRFNMKNLNDGDVKEQ